MTETLNDIAKILVTKYGVEASQISTNSKLLDLVDSVDRMYLLLDIKKKYSINIESSELVAISTIEDLINTILKSAGKNNDNS